MSDFLSILTGGTTGITFQASFSREVETVSWWGTASSPAGPAVNPMTFLPIPSGPVLFQTSGSPPAAAETLQIAEADTPQDIANWMEGKANAAVLRTFTLPAGQVFKQFIPVNGPYIGLKILGTSQLKVVAEGLVTLAPSTMLRDPNPTLVVTIGV